VTRTAAELETAAWPALPDAARRGRELLDGFRECFRRLGYEEHAPVPITSRIDPSVTLVGSTISVLKSLLHQGLPAPGVFLVQPALRTQNLRTMRDDDAFPVWCSYFTAFGLLAPPDRLRATALDLWSYFRNDAPVETSRIVLRASSRDADLLELLEDLPGSPEVEVDGYEDIRYRHRFGIDGVVGRNFNVAIRSEWGELRDVGNLILMEEDGRLIAVDVGFGVGTMLSRIHDLEHPIQASTIGSVVSVRSRSDVKFADALAAAVVLGEEGLRPNMTHRGKFLRSYLQAASHLRGRTRRSHEEVEELAAEFQRLEFGRTTTLPARIRRYVEEFERLSDVPDVPKSEVSAAALAAFKQDEASERT
jgi:hypothetical protein